MAKIADQALQRRYQLYRDQHNREWGGNVEIATGHPCGGPLSPRFQAPLRVPPHYITIDDRRAGRCLIDYPTWVHDLKQASTNYLNKGRRYGYEKYGALFDASRPFTEEVLLFLGPAPRPVEPVLAAKAGNRWVLGLLLPAPQAHAHGVISQSSGERTRSGCPCHPHPAPIAGRSGPSRPPGRSRPWCPSQPRSWWCSGSPAR